jgi:hypothetical protein
MSLRLLEDSTQRPGLAAVWVFVAVSDPMTIYIKGTNFYLNRKAN